MSLTDEEVLSIAPKSRAYKRYDSNGLFLEIRPNGRKWWRYRYFFEGKPTQISLGTYPSVSLDCARKERDVAMDLLYAGQNPSKVKRENKLLEPKVKKEKTQTTLDEAIFFASEIYDNLNYIKHLSPEQLEKENEFKMSAKVSIGCVEILRRFFRRIIKGG